MRPFRFLATAAALAGCEADAPEQGRRGGIEIVGGYAYSPVATEAAAYVTLINRGHSEDTLVSISTPFAGKVTLHESVGQGGLVRMESLTRLPLPPGTSVEMAPGGLHLMLTELKMALPAGRRLPLALVFARAGKLDVEIPIERYGSVP